MSDTVCGNHGKVDGFAGFGNFLKHRFPSPKFVVFLFVNPINIIRKLHFTKIDDAIVTVKKQVDLHTLMFFGSFDMP